MPSRSRCSLTHPIDELDATANASPASNAAVTNGSTPGIAASAHTCSWCASRRRSRIASRSDSGPIDRLEVGIPRTPVRADPVLPLLERELDPVLLVDRTCRLERTGLGVADEAVEVEDQTRARIVTRGSRGRRRDCRRSTGAGTARWCRRRACCGWRRSARRCSASPSASAPAYSSPVRIWPATVERRVVRRGRDGGRRLRDHGVEPAVGDSLDAVGLVDEHLGRRRRLDPLLEDVESRAVLQRHAPVERASLRRCSPS